MRDSPARAGFRLATLAAALAVLSAAPTVALGLIETTHEPVSDVVSAPAGTLVSYTASGIFEDAGTNPKFTGVYPLFDEYIEQYYTGTDPADGTSRFYLRVMSADALNALPSPPSNPIHTMVTVSITNDEGQTFTRSITFETRYRRIASYGPGPGQPTAVARSTLFMAPPGSTVGISPHDVFDHAGTNPVFTEVNFSTTDYYQEFKIHDSPRDYHTHGTISLTVKDNDQLNALPSPPRSPFQVIATLTMTNDEKQTATARLGITTQYLRNAADDGVEPLQGGGEDGG